MKKYLIIILLIVVINNLNAQDITSNLSERVFGEYALVQQKFIEVPVEIGNMSGIIPIDSTSFVVIDLSNNKFVFYQNGEFQLKNKITSGKGPGELKQLYGFYYDKFRNNYVLTDIANSKIIYLNKEFEYVDEVVIEGIVPGHYTSNPNDGKLIIASSNYTEKGFLHIINSNFKIERTFRTVENPNERVPIAFEGGVLAVEDGFYYFPRFKNEIVKYDYNGEILFDVMHVGNEENTTKIEVKKRLFGGVSYYRKNAKAFSGNSGFIVRGDLFIQYSGTEYTSAQYIDIYDPINGKYKSSIDVTKEDPFYMVAYNEYTFYFKRYKYKNGDIRTNIILSKFVKIKK